MLIILLFQNYIIAAKVCKRHCFLSHQTKNQGSHQIPGIKRKTVLKQMLQNRCETKKTVSFQKERLPGPPAGQAGILYCAGSTAYSILIAEKKRKYRKPQSSQLITSPVSFSCGNLVPNVFKQSGVVTLLGRTSGGGSCIVQSIATAWGTSFNISSNRRMSFLKNGALYDIDRGAEPDYTLSKPEKYYDRERLTEYINSLY